MKLLSKFLAISVLALASMGAGAGDGCQGKFMNPITDVCWSCAFPITLFGKTLDFGGRTLLVKSERTQWIRHE